MISSRTLLLSLPVLLPLVACQSPVGGVDAGVELEKDQLQWTALGASESPRVDPCIHPNGTDMNALFGIEDALVVSFCREIRTGTPWSVPIMWVGAHAFDAVPEAFEPAGSTPLEDWQAKLVSVTYVVDAGTFFPFEGFPRLLGV